MRSVGRRIAILGMLPWQIYAGAGVLVAGDTLNDLSMYGEGFPGVCVGESEPALVAATAGMDNVLQLDGGILSYFERVGGEGYDGRCFVFDGRIALDPALAPLADA